MAYQLSSYGTTFGLTLTEAYLRITAVNVNHSAKNALVTYSIHANATAAKDGVSTPVFCGGVSISGDDYTNYLAVVLGTDPSGTQPTAVTDIVQCQAYLALPNISAVSELLSGATAV